MKKISSEQNPYVKHLVKLRENARYRYQENALFASGVKLVQDLAKLIRPKKMIVSDAVEGVFPCEMVHVSYSIMKKITGQPAPDWLSAEFPLPEPTSLKKVSRLLILDQLKDPGNLGTILRTALALGWEGIYFLPGCVDPFHEKVTRASQAALFQIPWNRGSWEELALLKKSNHSKAYIADINGVPFYEADTKGSLMLILSHEASGASSMGKKFASKITIPMSGKVESLNVAAAAAILLYGLQA